MDNDVGMVTGGLNNNNQQGGMAHVPHHMQRQGMTYVDPNVPSMLNPGKNYTKLEEPEKTGDGLFANLFLQAYIRRLEQELETLKLTKSDLSGSTAAKTEFGYFSLMLKVFPGLIGIGSTLGALSLALFVFVSKTYSFEIGAIASFFFLMAFLFPYGKKVYELERHRIGEKDTGRFINNVKRAWRSFEIKYLMIIALFFTIFYGGSLMTDFANWLKSISFEKHLYDMLWHKFFNFLHIEIWHEASKYYLATLLLFAAFYMVGVLIISKKAKKKQAETVFELSKEFKRPFELVREKFKDIA